MTNGLGEGVELGEGVGLGEGSGLGLAAVVGVGEAAFERALGEEVATSVEPEQALTMMMPTNAAMPLTLCSKPLMGSTINTPQRVD
jgi:hypothetical protein